MNVVLQVAQIVAPVFLMAGLGYGWVRIGWDYDVAFVTRVSMTVSLPCLIYMALVRSDVDPGLLGSLVLGAVLAYAAVGLLVWGLVRAAGLDMATYWPPLTFGNTGNLGLPLAFFAFGQAGFDLAIVVFAVMAIISFTLGVWVVAGAGAHLAVLREPILWGTILGALSLAAGWRPPEWAAATLDLVGQMSIPLMLLTLGVAISRLHPRSLRRALWLSVVKLAICIAVPVAVGRWLALPPMALAVLVLQVATPVAVTSYMLAAKFHARADEVAGMVVVSTLISVAAIPAILGYFI
jgi:malate permease and related proteins